MKLIKKCLIKYNNKRTNQITKKEVNDNEVLRFTLLDMQKFAEEYHSEQLRIADVVGRSEQLVCDVCESTNNIQTYCGKCMEERC